VYDTHLYIFIYINIHMVEEGVTMKGRIGPRKGEDAGVYVCNTCVYTYTYIYVYNIMWQKRV